MSVRLALANGADETVLGSYGIRVNYPGDSAELHPNPLPLLTADDPTDTQTIKFTPLRDGSFAIQIDLSYKSFAEEVQIGDGYVTEKLYLPIATTEKTVLKEISTLQLTAITFQKTSNHQAFDKKLAALYKLVDDGTAEDYVAAMDKIKVDLVQKTDGVAPDWVTNACQESVLGQLQTIYNHLTLLQYQ